MPCFLFLTFFAGQWRGQLLSFFPFPGERRRKAREKGRKEGSDDTYWVVGLKNVKEGFLMKFETYVACLTQRGMGEDRRRERERERM